MKKMEHEMVPEHIKIEDDAEVEDILDRYGIKKHQLPKIKTSDPIIKEIGAKRGDVIKIIRKSYTAGVSVAYKLVIGKGGKY
jgi:DNA-directed RNA polymerase subunit H